LHSPLRHIESLNQRACQDHTADHDAACPREVRSVAVIGAGIMGTAIAAAGPRMEPTPLLLDIARREGRFYEPAP
jgi:hypothetical protein